MTGDRDPVCRMPGEHRMTLGMWLGIAVVYAFFGILAYHLFLQHRAHVVGALAYFAALSLVPLAYAIVRRMRSTKGARS